MQRKGEPATESPRVLVGDPHLELGSIRHILGRDCYCVADENSLCYDRSGVSIVELLGAVIWNDYSGKAIDNEKNE